MPLIKSFLFVLAICSSFVLHAEPFQMPSEISFIRSLPTYTYACELNKHFGLQSKKSQALALLKALDIQELPSDQNFNQQLSNILPRVLYTGIKKTAELNPELASVILKRAYETPILFLCDHLSTEYGGQAAASKKWIFVGQARIHLDVTVAQVLTKGSKYKGSQAIDETSAYRTIYHEFLHHLAHPSNLIPHASDALLKGAREDIVYSCSNHAFAGKPILAKRFQKASAQRPLIEGYVKSAAGELYGEYMIPNTPLEDIIPCIKKIKAKFEKLMSSKLERGSSFSSSLFSSISTVFVSNDPEVIECNRTVYLYSTRHDYNYAQCMACASAQFELENDYHSEAQSPVPKYMLTFNRNKPQAEKACADAPVHYLEAVILRGL